jgi:hypothetical protein
MDTLLHEQYTHDNNLKEKQVRLQNVFFSFSSSVFMKTGQLLGLFLSNDDISARQLAIQIFVTSLADATGDAYSLSVANTTSNLETYDIKAMINFFLSFISKFATGLIHVILYSLNIPVKYILAVDLIMFYSTITLSSYLIKKNQDIDMSFTKILTLQSIYATMFLGIIVGISRVFVNYI